MRAAPTPAFGEPPSAVLPHANVVPRGYGRRVGEVEVVEVAGHEVRITNPGKVFFPERGNTKLDLARYYLAVAEPLMAAMGGRPVLLQRFPNGVGGQNFFQKR